MGSTGSGSYYQAKREEVIPIRQGEKAGWHRKPDEDAITVDGAARSDYPR